MAQVFQCHRIVSVPVITLLLLCLCSVRGEAKEEQKRACTWGEYVKQIPPSKRVSPDLVHISAKGLSEEELQSPALYSGFRGQVGWDPNATRWVNIFSHLTPILNGSGLKITTPEQFSNYLLRGGILIQCEMTFDVQTSRKTVKDSQTCHNCRGKGTIVKMHIDGPNTSRTCPTCGGSGKIVNSHTSTKHKRTLQKINYTLYYYMDRHLSMERNAIQRYYESNPVPRSDKDFVSPFDPEETEEERQRKEALQAAGNAMPNEEDKGNGEQVEERAIQIIRRFNAFANSLGNTTLDLDNRTMQLIQPYANEIRSLTPTGLKGYNPSGGDGYVIKGILQDIIMVAIKVEYGIKMLRINLSRANEMQAEANQYFQSALRASNAFLRGN